MKHLEANKKNAWISKLVRMPWSTADPVAGGQAPATVRAAWLLEETPGVRRGWFTQNPHRKTIGWYL